MIGRDVLFRDTHEILRAQIHPQRVKQLVVSRVRVHAGACERIHGRRERERRHALLAHPHRRLRRHHPSTSVSKLRTASSRRSEHIHVHDAAARNTAHAHAVHRVRARERHAMLLHPAHEVAVAELGASTDDRARSSKRHERQRPQLRRDHLPAVLRLRARPMGHVAHRRLVVETQVRIRIVRLAHDVRVAIEVSRMRSVVVASGRLWTGPADVDTRPVLAVVRCAVASVLCLVRVM